MSKMAWCIRHKDGYCASKTPSMMPAEEDSMPTLCDHFITLPTGIRKGMPTCAECLKILFEGAGSGAGDRPRRGSGQSPEIGLPAGEAGVLGAAGAPERLSSRRRGL